MNDKLTERMTMHDINIQWNVLRFFIIGESMIVTIIILLNVTRFFRLCSKFITSTQYWKSTAYVHYKFLVLVINFGTHP